MSDKEKAPIQDQRREEQMIRLLGLINAEGRLGHDAEDKRGNIFELKSSTKDSFGTSRDVSIDMINKWRKRYWIFAQGINYKKGFEINLLYLCTPDMMKEQFDTLAKRFESDVNIRDIVVTNLKKILESSKLERLIYLINRGMTYNNPHISIKYVKEHGVEIDLQNPKTHLEKLMNGYP